MKFAHVDINKALEIMEETVTKEDELSDQQAAQDHHRLAQMHTVRAMVIEDLIDGIHKVEQSLQSEARAKFEAELDTPKTIDGYPQGQGLAPRGMQHENGEL